MLGNPLIGLFAWLVVAPFSRFFFLDITLGASIPDLTLTRICAITLSVTLIALLAIGKQTTPRLIALDFTLLIAVLAIAASAFATFWPFTFAITNWGDSYLVPLLIFFMTRLLIRTRRDTEWAITTFIIIGITLAAVAVEEQLSGRPLFLYSERSWVYTRSIHRLAGLLGSPAFFAIILAMVLPFIIHRWLTAATGIEHWLYAGAATMVGLGLFMTYNRAGWVSAILSMAIMAVIHPRWRRVFVAFALIAVIILALAWGFLQQSPVVAERLNARGPIEYRLEVLSQVAFFIRQNPLFGLGYFNFGWVYARYHPEWLKGTVLPTPHNSFLEVTINNGLLSAIPYTLSFMLMGLGILSFYRRARRAGWPGEAETILPFGLALLVYVMNAMVVDMLAGYYPNMIFMFIMGTVFAWQLARTGE